MSQQGLLLGRILAAQNDFRADGAAAHTGLPVFASRTALPEMLPERIKGRAVPCLLDGVAPQVYRPPLALIVKAAWEHFHVGGDISRPTSALAGIHAVHIDRRGLVYQARDRAGIEPDFVPMLPSAGEGEEFLHLRVVCPKHLPLGAKTHRLVEQEYDGVDTGREAALPQLGNRFVNGPPAHNIVYICFHAGLEQAVDGPQGVGAPIPAHCHSSTVFLAEPGKLRGHPQARGGEIRDDAGFPAEL